MGGFLYLKKDSSDNTTNSYRLEHIFSDSINVFREKGLSLEKKITTPGFVIYLFRKTSIQMENFLEFKNEDFIFATGTLIYKEKTGAAALKELFEDYVNRADFHSDLIGHYCVMIYYKKELHVFRDPGGFYAVYTNEDMSVISTSFLAVLAAVKTIEISRQEFYEYIFSGFFYTNKTLIMGIHLLDSRRIFKIAPVISGVPRNFSFKAAPIQSFDHAVISVLENLVKYFKIIKKIFNNSVSSALSGGYDTRLMLALMRYVGITPYLYVYGGDDSADVNIARRIAEGENLNLDHINKSKHPGISIEKFYDFIKKQFYLYDGLGPIGIFDDGANLENKLLLSAKTMLNLNGAGGEIYRECWNLPNRKISLKNFYKAKLDLYDYSFCTREFNKKEYFHYLREKIKVILDSKENYLQRRDLDKLFPFFRNKFAMFLISDSNQYNHMLLAFSEPFLIYQSFNIPFGFKNHGRFQAALIKYINENLSRYPSVYGVNFFDRIKLTKKIKDYLVQYFPFSLRPYLKLIRKRKKHELPYYLKKDFLERIFNMDKLLINRFLDISKIENPLLLSRVLSVELLLSKRFKS